MSPFFLWILTVFFNVIQLDNKRRNISPPQLSFLNSPEGLKEITSKFLLHLLGRDQGNTDKQRCK